MLSYSRYTAINVYINKSNGTSDTKITLVYAPGRLNMSNMRLVMINPPEMLIEDINAAKAANDVAVLLGSNPPPIMTSPPAAVIPEIALVTDMRGE